MSINIRAALDAEEACVVALRAKLADFGDGYVGAPRLKGGVLVGVNCWWFAVGGGPSSRQAPNAPCTALDMNARIEGVFADRARGWEFAFSAIDATPIRSGIVQACFLNGNPSCEYEYFDLDGRDGKHGLWLATVPLRIAFNCFKESA